MCPLAVGVGWAWEVGIPMDTQTHGNICAHQVCGSCPYTSRSRIRQRSQQIAHHHMLSSSRSKAMVSSYCRYQDYFLLTNRMFSPLCLAIITRDIPTECIWETNYPVDPTFFCWTKSIPSEVWVMQRFPPPMLLAFGKHKGMLESSHTHTHTPFVALAFRLGWPGRPSSG